MTGSIAMAKAKRKTVLKNKSATNPMWGGQFARGPAAIMAKINQSIDFDRKLYAQDIDGSLAHAQMLVKQKILTVTEGKAIERGLYAIRKEIESGKFVFKPELEDIHMNIEARLKEIIGEPAGKLHTARSRNDQVATDFRLYVREQCNQAAGLLHELIEALLERAEEEAATVMPGFTHLQVAQPITFGHHMMAYVEMFARDRNRFVDAMVRMNECPLGSAALAGTSFPIDRNATAKALGFARPTGNSLDAVGSRDFALEFLSAASICAVHMSRLAEEMVVWCSTPFHYISFSDAFTSGSSIMPQKRNPDAAELVRAKIGRIAGHFTALCLVVKGLPLAYNKDLQEDKEAVFDAAENLQLALAAMGELVRDLSVNRKAMRAAAETGYSTATDLADWLVRELKLPFREAHHVTAKIVVRAVDKNVKLDQLSLTEMQAVEKRITKDVFSVLSVESSVKSRKSIGGTAPEQVKKAIAAARRNYL